MDIQITDNSPAVLAELRNRIPLVLDEMGEIVEGYAKNDAPVDTGRLRNSITHQTEGNDEYIGTNVEYAPYVELIDRYNHTNGKAHFLRDAATTHGEEFKTTAEAILKNAD